MFLDLADVLTLDIWDNTRRALGEKIGQHGVQLLLLFWVSPAMETNFELNALWIRIIFTMQSF